VPAAAFTGIGAPADHMQTGCAGQFMGRRAGGQPGDGKALGFEADDQFANGFRRRWVEIGQIEQHGSISQQPRRLLTTLHQLGTDGRRVETANAQSERTQLHEAQFGGLGHADRSVENGGRLSHGQPDGPPRTRGGVCASGLMPVNGEAVGLCQSAVNWPQSIP
jgi:hypothetical protein